MRSRAPSGSLAHPAGSGCKRLQRTVWGHDHRESRRVNPPLREEGNGLEPGSPPGLAVCLLARPRFDPALVSDLMGEVAEREHSLAEFGRARAVEHLG